MPLRRRQSSQTWRWCAHANNSSSRLDNGARRHPRANFPVVVFWCCCRYHWCWHVRGGGNDRRKAWALVVSNSNWRRGRLCAASSFCWPGEPTVVEFRRDRASICWSYALPRVKGSDTVVGVVHQWKISLLPYRIAAPAGTHIITAVSFHFLSQPGDAKNKTRQHPLRQRRRPCSNNSRPPKWFACWAG